MRCFIAIELSEEIKNELGRIQSHLRFADADVTWTKKDRIHLTLKFLGEIPEEKVAEISETLDEAVSSTASFEISLSEVGVFPKPSHPRVIWVGIENGRSESIELAGLINEKLATLGFEKEDRPFNAHLTLGRVKSLKNREALVRKMESANIGKPLSQPVNSIILFKSVLTPNGPIYTKLHESFLAD
ncbi:MAG: RNA 2',3'-cyclic phosphodiesterase [Candidatus Omnitrophota bacterium]